MKKMTSFCLTLLLIVSLALPTAFAEAADSSGDDIKNRKLTEDELAVAVHVIENFVALAQVPRPSHQEEKASTFLMEWAKEQGLDPRQDEVLNVIFDVPATEGYENYPTVGLQAHMDMVCVGDSPDYDPENDPVKVVVDYDDATMTADGTSLGSDDGIGCAIIMSTVQGLAPHGPLRVIFTVDEEDGMTGILNLDPSNVADLKYLINVDSEVSDTVTVSSAGGTQIDISSPKETGKAPEGDLAVKVSVSGLAGGHSGVDINKGRLNAIFVLDSVLEKLAGEEVFYEIASMEGGTASNAIPSKAEAVLVIHAGDLEKVVSAAAEQEATWKAEYESTEPNLSISATEADAVPDTVVSPALAEKTHALMDGIVNGVYSMSEAIDGLVESSSNQGVLRLSPEEMTASCYVRSSSGEKQEEILAIDRKVIEENGLDAEYSPSGDPWPYNPDSVLLPLTQEVYLEQNGSEIKAEAIHATLECGTFSVMNPELDMVSIGPDLENVHSTGEMLYLRTIPKTFNLLAGILNGIAEADAADAASLLEQARPLLEAEDYEAAVPLLREEAGQGNAEAQNELGKCYALGLGVEKNDEEAVRYYRMAADQGFAKSQFNLGNSYLYGVGVEQDNEKAVEYLQAAAEQGLVHAQSLLGYMYENGFGVEENPEKAAEYYQAAADQGDAYAQNNLGNCYFYGRGVKKDIEKGVQYFQLAAEQGEPDALNNLGYCYSDGIGVEQDYEKAAQYFQAAADQGNADAIYNIGYSYYFGEGVEEDDDTALEYFRTAAEMGQPYAMFLIGESYYEGKGNEQNLEKAAEWYLKALRAGYEPDEQDQKHLSDLFAELYNLKLDFNAT